MNPHFLSLLILTDLVLIKLISTPSEITVFLAEIVSLVDDRLVLHSKKVIFFFEIHPLTIQHHISIHVH